MQQVKPAKARHGRLRYNSSVPTFKVHFPSRRANATALEYTISAVFWGTVVVSLLAWTTGCLSGWSSVALAALARLGTQRCRRLPNTWDATVDYFRAHISGIGPVWKAAIRSTSYGSAGAAAFVVSAHVLAFCAHLGLLQHSLEVIAIAKRARVFVGDLLVMQYVYEACACCTAIVMTTPSGACMHLRTMDWEMPFNLRPVTFVVEGFVDGVHVFSATTWPAYVGFLTGVRLNTHRHSGSGGASTIELPCPEGDTYHHRSGARGAFSLSTNFRLGGQGYKHNFVMFLAGGATIGNLLRACLLEDSTYDAAVARLTRAWLISPAYITVACGSTSRAMQITRSRMRQLHPLTLKVMGQRGNSAQQKKVQFTQIAEEDIWHHDECGNVRIHHKVIARHASVIVQANIDHWQKFPDFMTSLSRQSTAQRLLSNPKVCCPTTDFEDWIDYGWEILSQHPIFNSKTIYAAVMVPAEGLYQCRVGTSNNIIAASNANEPAAGSAAEALARLAAL